MSTSFASTFARFSAVSAARVQRSENFSPGDTIRRSRIPVRDVIHSSDVSTSFSRSAFERTFFGTAAPVPTIMACCVPVLTSSTSALQEIAGGYALLVDPMDVSAIAKGISEIATNAERRAELVALGRRRAADFSWDRAAAQTLKVYAEALGNGGVSREP